MQIADNHPYFTQLQFHIEVVKMMISDFLSRQHAIQEGTVQTGHWPVKMSKGRCKRCLKRKKNNVLPDGMQRMWREVLLQLVEESQNRSLMWHEIQTP